MMTRRAVEGEKNAVLEFLRVTLFSDDAFTFVVRYKFLVVLRLT